MNNKLYESILAGIRKGLFEAMTITSYADAQVYLSKADGRYAETNE